MKTIKQVKILEELDEFREQYLIVNENYRVAQMVMNQTNNSTSTYLKENLNYEKRKEIIRDLELSGCPQNHIVTLNRVHEVIYAEFNDNFENHEGKTAIFDFYNLVNVAVDIINVEFTSNSSNKIKNFLKFKKE